MTYSKVAQIAVAIASVSTTFFISTKLLSQMPPPVREGKDITGVYQVDGKNPDNSTYKGNLNITGEGGNYNLTWQVGKDTFNGIGRLRDNTLAVGWGGDKCGVVNYQIQNDGSLVGEWILSGKEGKGEETALRQSQNTGDDIAGEYNVTGNFNNASAYQGKLSVKRVGSLYEFVWQLNAEIKGLGVRQADTVAVSWGDTPCNVVLYQVREDGNLSGVWGLSNEQFVGTEEAVRLNKKFNLKY